MSSLAWYVHHDGQGHAARAVAFAAASPLPVTLVSELDLSDRWDDTVLLAPDAPPVGPARTSLPDPTANGRLHWAPIWPGGLAARAAVLVDVLRRPGLVGLVTDVSVEAGLLARLCGVPVVAVHEMGIRHDAAHDLGRACAAGLLAPYPAALADASLDPGYPCLFHSGFVPRPADGSRADRRTARARLGLRPGPTILVAFGGGGHGAYVGDLEQLVAMLPGAEVVVVGRMAGPCPQPAPAGVRIDGWVPSIADHLAAADVVVASAGSSLVAEVAAARRPLVCVPEKRPFAEQEERARRLRAAGVASIVPSWADHRGLAAAVDEALCGEDRWSRIEPGPGPTVAMDWVIDRLERVREGAS